MELVRRTVALAGVAALAWLAGCAKGGDSSAATADSTPSPESVTPRRDSALPPVLPAATPAAAIPAPPPARGGTPVSTGVSVATGVYTTDQAARGREVYTTSCGQCHTMGQHSGSAFATAWNNRRLYDLYDIVRNTMPLDNPGGLPDHQYIEVVAYMLELNGVPAGKTSLQADAAALKGLRIDVKPSAGQ